MTNLVEPNTLSCNPNKDILCYHNNTKYRKKNIREMTSRKKRTPKNNQLYQAVEDMMKKKTVQVKTIKTPKNKTPKKPKKMQMGGDEDNFLSEIQNMLFHMNHVNYNGIGIRTTLIPFENPESKQKTFTEITPTKVIIDKMTNEDSDKNTNKNTNKQGGYGKKYVNNNIRLNEGLNDYSNYEL